MLQLLCRGEDGALFTGEFHLPYSQIMDAGEDSEEGMCSMDLLFTDVKCTPVEEDRRSFQVELAVQAQAVLRCAYRFARRQLAALVPDPARLPAALEGPQSPRATGAGRMGNK